MTVLIGAALRFVLPEGVKAEMAKESSLSPLARLLQLEDAVQRLGTANLPASVRTQAKDTQPRVTWPCDQLLLTRILRRSPEILKAYQAPAELTGSSDDGIYLYASNTESSFYFGELADGNAVVWVSDQAPDWVWQSSVFISLFKCPPISDDSPRLILQELPLFVPISRGESWVMRRQGEMVFQSRPFPEQADQARLLRRIESLERVVSQHQIQQAACLKDLQIQVRSQQSQIDQLLRVFQSRDNFS